MFSACLEGLLIVSALAFVVSSPTTGVHWLGLCLALCLQRSLDHIVKTFKETRAVSLFKRSRASRDISQFPEMGHQFPVRKSTADGFLREDTAFRVQRASAFLKAPCSKRNIA